MVKKVQFDPGAVLDRVISSAQPEDECYLYKLADFKKSGQLVDAFNQTGSKVRYDNFWLCVLKYRSISDKVGKSRLSDVASHLF